MAASAPLTPAAYRQIVDKFGNVANFQVMTKKIKTSKKTLITHQKSVVLL